MEEKQELSLLERLQEMAQVDIQTVDPKELVDIESVKIQTGLPDAERMDGGTFQSGDRVL